LKRLAPANRRSAADREIKMGGDEDKEDKNERVITLETGGKAMRESKSISITVVGLVSGLFSMVPTVLAKDRHDIARVEAAEGTFTTIDFTDAIFTAALDINSAGKIVGEYVSAGTVITTAFCETGMASSPR
jgi:hypothetical protein